MATSDVDNEGRLGSSPIPIPDLRFEQSYLAGIKPYINIRLSQFEPNVISFLLLLFMKAAKLLYRSVR